MVEIIYTNKFQKEFVKIDNSIKEKLKKQIKKIVETPDIGKPLKYDLKGERTVYVRPFRIIYSFINNTLFFLRFEHRSEVYE
jgi:mRNA-degrading endonuclease RelE of RelBE toxin-antitoxin system